MRRGILLTLIGLVLSGNPLQAADVLIRNANIYDGTGKPPFTADVRVHAGRIAAVARHLRPLAGESMRDARGLALAPGFIDMHTHGRPGWAVALSLARLLCAA